MAVLDSAFLIDLSRGVPAATVALSWLIEREAPLLVPAHAASEYLAGFDDPVEALADVESGFRLVPFGREHMLRSSRLAREALARGTFPGWPDTWIATTAALEGDFVVSANAKHFRALECPVWDYRNEPAPPG